MAVPASKPSFSVPFVFLLLLTLQLVVTRYMYRVFPFLHLYEHRGRVITAREVPVLNIDSVPAIMTDSFRSFPQTHQTARP